MYHVRHEPGVGWLVCDPKLGTFPQPFRSELMAAQFAWVMNQCPFDSDTFEQQKHEPEPIPVAQPSGG
jgi:hypothetical protein